MPSACPRTCASSWGVGVADPQRAAAQALAFRRLQDTFVSGLVQRAQEIRAASPEELVTALHRLAGAAGVLKFDALGLAAREGELAVRADPAAAPVVRTRMLALIDQAVSGHDTES